MEGMNSFDTDLSALSAKERRWVLTAVIQNGVPHDFNARTKVLTVKPRYPADEQYIPDLLRDVKWEMDFVPIRHRSIVTVPHNLNAYKGDDLKQSIERTFRFIAVRAYWAKVEGIMQSHQVDILEARRMFHATGTLPKRREQREAEGEVHQIDDPFWHTEDYTIAFMLQFEDWQQKTYNVQLLQDADYRKNRQFSWELGKNRKLSIAEYVNLMGDDTRIHLPQFLIYCDRIDDAEALFSDPLWGDDAKFEVRSEKDSQAYADSEKLRINKSHEHVQQIHKIIRAGSPTNYNVFYPYPPNQWHNVPDAMCFMGDGSFLVRLQVMDTVGLTRYKLAQIRDEPWYTDSDGNRQHDFDFAHFGINVGDEFDHAKLLEVLNHGIARILQRHKRYIA